MADFICTTVSEGGKLKEGSVEEVRKIIGEWIDKNQMPDVTIEVDDSGVLDIYGYDDFYIFDDEEGDVTDDALQSLCQHLAEPLVIKSVGHEKCRYVQAFAYIVDSFGVKSASLENDIERVFSENTPAPRP